MVRKIVNSNNNEYESISSAARLVGVHQTVISNSIINGTKAGGFRWRYLDTDFINPKKVFKKAVYRDDNTEYSSLSEAAKYFNTTASTIHKAIKNNRMYKGYIWKYRHVKEVPQVQVYDEIWKDHPTIPVRVSNQGRVDNFRITFGSNVNGYREVRVNKKNYKIHRLVSETFNPNPESLPQVDHIDGDKTNNKAENLRWCTAKQNVQWYHNKKLTN